jgi:transcriptional regulator with GAF, ATPase, and Fis domain
MRKLFATLERVAATDYSVLVNGDTGTGKELVARALHHESSRRSQPFIVVDCAAIPESLIESQLFGHARGAFTGALTARTGDFEAANGGTIFLDEIGELPPSVQPKLLRVLESRTIRRVGESQPRPVDVRIISATHRDLLSMVGAGTFREDLYFRIASVPVRIPPLRDRLEDLPLLVQRFLPPSHTGVLPADLAEELSTQSPSLM